MFTHLPTGMYPPSNGFTELPCWTVTDSHIDTAVEKKGNATEAEGMVKERVSNLLRVGLND